MPFGLLKVGSTFQRVMEFSFGDLVGKIIEIYQDDLIMVSKEWDAHVQHLRRIFNNVGNKRSLLILRSPFLGLVMVNYWDISFLRMLFIYTMKESNRYNQ
jgi:hypothetical protein